MKANGFVGSFLITLFVSGQAFAEDEGSGQEEVIESAERLTEQFVRDGVQYRPHRPLEENESDCSDFVRRVENEAGHEVGNVSTRELPTSPEYRRISPDEAELGDVILQPAPDATQSGHMGIYSGDDDQGRSWGYQMGKHGAKDAPAFGDDPEFYRYNTTEDLEDQIQEQLETLMPDDSTTVGEQPSTDDSE
ncbi:MAG: C40 family peptidase [Archangium sp.]|nr:C40 family peptidase [Archangium sp.]